MPDSKLDETLSEFLTAAGEEKRKGFTLANLFAEIHEYRKAQRILMRRVDSVEDREEARDERLTSAHERLDAHRDAIVSVKRHIRKGNQDISPEFHEEMDTGNFDLAAIKREVEEQKNKRLNSERIKAEDVKWWKQTIILWIVGGFGFVAATAVTILITMAIANSRPIPQAPQIQQQNGK